MGGGHGWFPPVTLTPMCRGRELLGIGAYITNCTAPPPWFLEHRKDIKSIGGNPRRFQLPPKDLNRVEVHQKSQRVPSPDACQVGNLRRAVRLFSQQKDRVQNVFLSLNPPPPPPPPPLSPLDAGSCVFLVGFLSGFSPPRIMDNGSKPEIPSIVTEDLSSTPAIHVANHDESASLAFPTTSSGHSRKPSDPTLLSPGILKPGRRSIDTSADEDEFKVIPPSPTLSTQSSVHFMTSTALRENKPGDGSTSLSLLSPKDNSRSHSRRPSNATTTSTEEGTVADHSPGLLHLYPATSDVTTVRSAVGTLNSPTPTHVGSASDIGDSEKRRQKHKKSRKKGKGNAERTPEEGGDDEEDEEDKQMVLDLTQDEHIDPTPFSFKPYHLAALVDPKSLESLEAMGGIDGLLAGLGVDPANGLSVGGKTSESGDTPAVAVTDPAGEKGEAKDKSTHQGPAYNGSVEDRRRVYGSNVLPVRKSKSLLELMWLALKDKVLVSF